MSPIFGILLTGAVAIAGTVLSPSPTALGETRNRIARLVLAIAACLAIAGTPALAGEMIRGRATILNGSTLAIEGITVTLFGIAAPAPDATCWNAHGAPYACGHRVSDELTARIGTDVLTCERQAGSDDRHIEAVCRVGDEDLGDWMVARGYAVPAHDAPASYREASNRAWGRRAGLWAGVFDDPTDWRRAAR